MLFQNDAYWQQNMVNKHMSTYVNRKKFIPIITDITIFHIHFDFVYCLLRCLFYITRKYAHCTVASLYFIYILFIDNKSYWSCAWFWCHQRCRCQLHTIVCTYKYSAYYVGRKTILYGRYILQYIYKDKLLQSAGGPGNCTIHTQTHNLYTVLYIYVVPYLFYFLIFFSIQIHRMHQIFMFWYIPTWDYFCFPLLDL